MKEGNELMKEYLDKFGKEPNIIGMFRNPAELDKNLRESIKKGEPYDEYKLLTKEEQKAWDAGDIDF
jgi:hypothetical protein